MKNKSLDFRQIEWWMVTITFVCIILFNLISQSSYLRWSGLEGVRSLKNVLVPSVIFASFYIVHMKLVPTYIKNRNVWQLVGFSLLTLTGSLILSVIATVSLNGAVPNVFFLYFGMVLLYASYHLSAFVIKEMLTPPRFQDFSFYNQLRLILAYLFLILFLVLSQRTITNEVALVFFILIVPAILIVIAFNYFLIYRNRQKGKTKRANWFLALLLGIILLIFFIIAADNNEEFIFLIGVMVAAIAALIVIPLSNLVFKKYDSFTGTITTLTTQVNQGNASMDFLRSQINPHFLFNALNTLYASSLMENAEKTSDGIQKLGDMMRFMLHENQMPQIPVSREITYLKNYLDLQMLRFGAQKNLDVDIQINENQCSGNIAPMLIIPFVENAFKHGISSKEKSWIKINLRCIAGSLHLDVVNSVHPEKSKSEQDREESGIGLENVKKRLELTYPEKHELSIVSNDSDFFVHFSIQLQ
ncbi:sensor histidine kinase [Algoriphagus zhangzhouensis]|uniref:Histidine kinase n=1 Tax=Algoriphagus zhangzhouensis TaxID=1073327 RepID=A0A1M7Z562_9BACT|nr:histidine kinase [Algoriphagus zhangzhouensis]TDY48822.1 histidine kinase [Algoriphagus zhangzhouensis]SHO60009.1 Histidine kinase [Algoriphagus zhangzhouensis]